MHWCTTLRSNVSPGDPSVNWRPVGRSWGGQISVSEALTADGLPHPAYDLVLTPFAQCKPLGFRSIGASGTCPTDTPYRHSGGQIATNRAYPPTPPSNLGYPIATSAPVSGT